jgi:uncharacterized ferredoxin-like protein
MIRDVKDIKNEGLKFEASFIMNRMLTAPKARGEDDVRIIFVDGDEKKKLADEMRKMGDETGRAGYIRDAANLDKAAGALILGSRRLVMNLDCGMCGIPTCTEALKKDINCIYPLVDLGIALGSGVSLAAGLGIDNRVMYTLGNPCIRLKFFNDDNIRAVAGIPLSVSSENIFFDRK